MAAVENTTTTNDISLTVKELDFVSRFTQSLNIFSQFPTPFLRNDRKSISSF